MCCLRGRIRLGRTEGTDCVDNLVEHGSSLFLAVDDRFEAIRSCMGSNGQSTLGHRIEKVLIRERKTVWAGLLLWNERDPSG